MKILRIENHSVGQKFFAGKNLSALYAVLWMSVFLTCMCLFSCENLFFVDSDSTFETSFSDGIIENSSLFCSEEVLLEDAESTDEEGSVKSGSIIQTVFETNSTDFKSNSGFTVWAQQNDDYGSFETIEVAVQKVQGSLSYGYGVVFGIDETKNSMLVLMIRVNGEYIIGKVEDGRFSSICEWTKSSFLNTGTGNINSLRIERIDGEYQVYFNESLETSFFDFRNDCCDSASYGYAVVIAPNENFPYSKVKVIFSKKEED